LLRCWGADVPSHHEFEWLLRDAPRFELSAGEGDFSFHRWQWLGESIVRTMVQNKLRRSMGPVLKEQLHLYGQGLSLWTRMTIEKMQVLVSSYADAGRVQLYRMSGASGESADLPQLESDLSALRDWGTDKEIAQRA
jgi:hypothetical protein